MTSQPHRVAILSHLNEISINPSISLDEILNLVYGPSKVVMLTDSDLLEESNHNISLRITTKCNGFKVSRVLIYNRSAINIRLFRVL